MIQEKRRARQMSGFAMDVLHVVIGVVIVIFAVLAFLNPEENQILFPGIFLLAAILNTVKGLNQMKGNRDKKKRASGVVLIGVGTALFILCVLSLLTIWWG